MEATFNKEFLEYGGLYHTSNSLFKRYIEIGNQSLDGLDSFGRQIRELPNVYFNFINNPKLNAKARITENNIGLIGYNSGGLYIAYDLYTRILSHSGTLLHIGDPDQEKYNGEILRNYYNDAHDLLNFGNIDYSTHQFIPNNKNRIAYACFLHDISFEFIMNHELVHIVNGHLEYERNSSEKLDSLTYQTLEMDADCISLSKVLAKHVRRYTGEIYTPPGYKFIYQDFNGLLFAILFAINCLYRVLAQKHFYTESSKCLTDLDHSKPRIRQIDIMYTVDAYFEKYFSELNSRFDKQLYSQVVLEVEETFKKLTGIKPNANDFKEAATNLAKEQRTKILENWKIIRPKLMEHSYFELIE